MAEKPFNISISEEALTILSQKLALTRLPEETFDDWSYGVPQADIRRLLTRWKDGYDWRAAEAKLNKELPMFTRGDIEVDDFGPFKTHYVHKKSDRKGAIPLLFLHGWPGHFGEVRHILPLLTKPENEDDPAFHVVAPSLPGFGFTSAPTKKGFALPQYAEFAHKLMLSLGYSEYVTQGGDWGHWIAQLLARRYGHKHVKAWHSNFPMSGPPLSPWHSPFKFLTFLVTLPTLFFGATKENLLRSQKVQKEEQGYFAIQSTKPHTLGVSLADSPVGLLAWIYEKLITWTDDYSWEDDEVLTWISIYYHSLSGPAASVRIYYEHVHAGPLIQNEKLWSSVPLGLSFFPKEIVVLPKLWSRTVGNVVYEGDHTKGGHFAAYENPGALAGDLRNMFGKGGPVYRAVSGQDGYNGS